MSSRRLLTRGLTLGALLLSVVATVQGQSVSQTNTNVTQQCNEIRYKVAPDEVVFKECKMATGDNCLVVVHPNGSSQTCITVQTNTISK